VSSAGLSLPGLPPLVRRRRTDFTGGAFTTLSGLAALLIVAMVAVIVGEIAWNGAPTVTWEFLTAVPRHGGLAWFSARGNAHLPKAP